MHISFYGLRLQVERISVALWSPWRSSKLEHRLFDSVRKLPNVRPEPARDEEVLVISDELTWEAALQGMIRILKGWQEDAAPGSEKRHWRWFVEGDSDAYGYDHGNEPFTLWVYLRLLVEQGMPSEDYKVEEIELGGLNIRFWPGR